MSFKTLLEHLKTNLPFQENKNIEEGMFIDIKAVALSLSLALNLSNSYF